MAALPQKLLPEDSGSISLNPKLQKGLTSLDSEYDKSKKGFKESESKKIQEENHKTLKAFLSESLLYDPKSVGISLFLY